MKAEMFIFFKKRKAEVKSEREGARGANSWDYWCEDDAINSQPRARHRKGMN